MTMATRLDRCGLTGFNALWLMRDALFGVDAASPQVAGDDGHRIRKWLLAELFEEIAFDRSADRGNGDVADGVREWCVTSPDRTRCSAIRPVKSPSVSWSAWS